ncbi:hypothetical protein OA345_01505, partial [Flavobacteriales bacterium]|nr:hypothetical protein [Flavobacteriales bacterium]
NGSLLELTPGGFYTGNAADANAGGYWPVGEHGQFAMTSDDGCRPGGVTPNNNNSCDLSFEKLILPELDFTGQEDVYLIFEYYHDQSYGGGDAVVQISTDGGNSFVDLSGPLPALAEWQQGIFSLSDYNNQPSVIIQFIWSDGGGSGNWGSGLAIDDIEIAELNDNSLSIPLFNQWLAGFDGFVSSYSQIPLSMINNSAGIILQAYAFNEGNLTQDSVRLHVSESATGFSSQSTAVNLEQFVQDTLYCNENFQPTSTGVYQLDYYLQSDNVTTNTVSKSIQITDYIYARDDNEIDEVNSLLPVGDGISSWEIGNIYDIYESNALYAIDVYIHNGTTANAKIQGKVYLYQDDQSIFLAETNLLSVTASDGWQSIIFSNPVLMDAGNQYLITVGGDGSALNDTLRIGSSYVQSSYGYVVYNGWVDSNGTMQLTDGTTGSTPMVRMICMNTDIIVYGCIDENACNYDENANSDDGSCLYPVSHEESYSTCNDFEWNGEIYSQSGVYTYTTSGSNGCDSTAILYLTINLINVSVDMISCDEYLWEGEVYYESGIYTFETINENGCDSIVYLNLTIVEGLESQNIIGQDEVVPFTQYIYALELNGNDYSWSVTNGSLITDNGNSIEVVWGEEGIGLIEVIETNSNGCSITHSLQIDLGNGVENSWNCSNEACIDPLDGTGMYQSFEECDAICNTSSIIEPKVEVSIYPNPSSYIFNVKVNSLS